MALMPYASSKPWAEASRAPVLVVAGRSPSIVRIPEESRIFDICGPFLMYLPIEIFKNRTNHIKERDLLVDFGHVRSFCMAVFDHVGELFRELIQELQPEFGARARFAVLGMGDNSASGELGQSAVLLLSMDAPHSSCLVGERDRFTLHQSLELQLQKAAENLQGRTGHAVQSRHNLGRYQDKAGSMLRALSLWFLFRPQIGKRARILFRVIGVAFCHRALFSPRAASFAPTRSACRCPGRHRGHQHIFAGTG